MKNVRIWFEKKGAVKYISHLDLTRCMARALKMSGLPVWYTEGFNPRIYMTYAMPLSLGMCGLRECMDIRLTQEIPLEQVVLELNAQLPNDIHVWAATDPKEKFEAIQYAEYELDLETENAMELQKKLEKLLARNELIVRKHGKKGDKDFDIKPSLSEISWNCKGPEHLMISLQMPCSVSGSVNPSLLLEALKNYEGEEPYAQITRKRMLTKDFCEIA